MFGFLSPYLNMALLSGCVKSSSTAVIKWLHGNVQYNKNAFPETPQTDTRINSPFAHNFDFGVFDLNNLNKGLPTDEGLKYGKEANFICPFDVLPEDLKKDYYSKIIPSEKSFTNCKAY